MTTTDHFMSFVSFFSWLYPVTVWGHLTVSFTVSRGLTPVLIPSLSIRPTVKSLKWLKSIYRFSHTFYIIPNVLLKTGQNSVGMQGPISLCSTLIQVSHRRIIVWNWMLNVDNMHTLEAIIGLWGSQEELCSLIRNGKSEPMCVCPLKNSRTVNCCSADCAWWC